MQSLPTGAFDVSEECGGIKAAARGFADDVFCRHAVTDLMNIAVEPCQQMLELTAFEVTGQAMGCLIRFCQIRRIQAADRVRRKIAEHTHRPVRILKHSISIACRCVPEQ